MNNLYFHSHHSVTTELTFRVGADEILEVYSFAAPLQAPQIGSILVVDEIKYRILSVETTYVIQGSRVNVQVEKLLN